jgi:hypothetical protein
MSMPDPSSLAMATPGDKTSSGKTRTRLIHLAIRGVPMKIDAPPKTSSGLADHGDSHKT